jgi:hypothetical protein
VAHGERERHNAAHQERAMFSGPKSKATGLSWVYDALTFHNPVREGLPTNHVQRQFPLEGARP